MRIAFITSYPLDVRIGSGVVRLVQGFAKALAELGHDSHIISPPEINSTTYLSLANERLRFNRNLHRHDFSSYDIVIGSDFDGYALNLASRIRYYNFNGGILADLTTFESGKTGKILHHLAKREKQNAQKALIVLVPSEYTKQRVHFHYNIDENKIIVIPLGSDINRLKIFCKKTIRNNKFLPQILCVARQYPRKGIPDLIRAFALVVKKIPQAKLNIVGSGPEEQSNIQLSRSLGLMDSITFFGDISDFDELCKIYTQNAVFCLPSYHETFGLVFLEAMAFGLPIVGYRTTSVPEVVPHEAGILSPAGDLACLAKNLLDLIQDENKASKMGRAGKKYAEKMSWELAAQRLLIAINQRK